MKFMKKNKKSSKETTYASFTTTTEEQTSRGSRSPRSWLGCASSNPCMVHRQQERQRGRARGRGRAALVAKAVKCIQVGLAVGGTHIAHVSPHVAHVCATLRLVVPPQGHRPQLQMDMRETVCRQRFYLLSLPLASCHCRKGVKSHKDTRTLHAACCMVHGLS